MLGAWLEGVSGDLGHRMGICWAGTGDSTCLACCAPDTLHTGRPFRTQHLPGLYIIWTRSFVSGNSRFWHVNGHGCSRLPEAGTGHNVQACGVCLSHPSAGLLLLTLHGDSMGSLGICGSSRWSEEALKGSRSRQTPAERLECGQHGSACGVLEGGVQSLVLYLRAHNRGVWAWLPLTCQTAWLHIVPSALSCAAYGGTGPACTATPA